MEGSLRVDERWNVSTTTILVDRLQRVNGFLRLEIVMDGLKADRFNANAMFKAAADVAARGWKIVRLWGVNADGSCTCGRSECSTPGKHPHGGAGWPERATSDESEIAEWFEEDRPVNIGLFLGAASGVIDVECDSPEAAKALKEFRLDLIDTPMYRSSRGEHRLFRFEAGLPDAAVVKVNGIEVRIGGGGKSAQSVLPPSWHKSGVQYQWLPGRSPAEVDLAPLPEHFKIEVHKNAKGSAGGGCVRQSREALAGGVMIGEGGRHRYLLGVASDLAFKEPNLDSPDVRDRLFTLVQGVNLTRCTPPKSFEEVQRIVDEQIAFYKESREAGRADLKSDDPTAKEKIRTAKSRWTACGLIKNGNQWSPGAWRLVVVHSDPRVYRLVIPNPAGREPFAVPLSSDEFQSGAKVSRKILDVTGTMNMNDPTRAAWDKVWSGHKREASPGQWVDVRGLQAQLLDEDFRSEEEAPPEQKRYAMLAGMLLGRLNSARPVKDDADTKPSASGAAKWLVYQGKPELWFDWNVVISEIEQTHRIEVTTADRRDLHERVKEVTGKTGFKASQPRVDGSRRRFLRWSQQHLDALAQIAGLNDGGG
jgi:hypothetical protein